MGGRPIWSAFFRVVAWALSRTNEEERGAGARAEERERGILAGRVGVESFCKSDNEEKKSKKVLLFFQTLKVSLIFVYRAERHKFI